MPKPKEADVLAACLMLLNLHGVFAWRNNSTGVFDPARKCFRSFRGLKGTADILGILPGGKALCVECKRPGGVPSAEQTEFLQRAGALGALAIVVSDVRQLEAALKAEGVLGG